MSVVPGSAVFDRLMSHTSTESNTDSPPLEYMPGGSREQQLFQFDQNMLLSNWLRDDSQSVAATSVRIGENLSMVDFHDNYSYHDEFTHTQNDQSRESTQSSETQASDNQNSQTTTTGEYSNSVPASAFNHIYPSVLQHSRRPATAGEYWRDKRLLWLRYLSFALIGMFAAAVFIICFQMAFQLNNANAAPTEAKSMVQPTPEEISTEANAAPNEVKPLVSGHDEFVATDYCPRFTKDLSERPDAKFVCETVCGYWSEQFQKCYKLSKSTNMYEEAKRKCENSYFKLGYPNTKSEAELMSHVFKQHFKIMPRTVKVFLGLNKTKQGCASIDGKVNYETNDEFPEAKSACTQLDSKSFGALNVDNAEIEFVADKFLYYFCTFDGVEVIADHYY